MPFLTQPSPFPGLGLAPPMAQIMVEAGEKNLFANRVEKYINYFILKLLHTVVIRVVLATR
jgi:hypothetical protein